MHATIQGTHPQTDAPRARTRHMSHAAMVYLLQHAWRVRGWLAGGGGSVRASRQVLWRMDEQW